MGSVKVRDPGPPAWRTMSGGVPSRRAAKPPRQVAVEASSGTLRVTWQPPWDDGGSPVTGYTVTISPDDAPNAMLGADVSEHTFTGLTNGTLYTITLTAANQIGTSAAAELAAIPSGEWVLGSIGPIVGAPDGWGAGTLVNNGKGAFASTAPPPGVTNGYQMGPAYCGVRPVLLAQGKDYEDLRRVDETTLGPFTDAKGLVSGTMQQNPTTGELGLTITRPGALVEYIDLVGALVIRAPNVTVRYCRIDTSGLPDKGKYSINVKDQWPGLVISYCEIIAGFAISAVIPPYGAYTARYLDVWNISNDAFKTGTDCLVEFCWTHILNKAPAAHADSHQITAGTNAAVRFCRFDLYNGPDTNETPAIPDFANATTIVGHMTGDSSWFLFEDNYNDGSNILVRVGVPSPQTVSRGTFYTTHYFYRRNRYGLRFFGGPVTFVTGTDPSFVYEDETNVWHTSGQTFHRTSGANPRWYYSHVVEEGQPVSSWTADHFGEWAPTP